MINQKTYSFLIKFSIFILVFLGISFIVNSFIVETEDQKENLIPFLAITDLQADSLIFQMNLDKKIDLIIQVKKNINQDSILKWIYNTNDSITPLVNNVITEDKQFLKLCNLTNYTYLNSIADTVFVNNYLHQLNNTDSMNCILSSIDNDQFKSCKDSTFVNFLIQKFLKYQKIEHPEHILLGNKICYKNLIRLDLLKNDSNYKYQNLNNFLMDHLDVIYIDSAENVKISSNYKGIVITSFEDNSVINKDILIKFINGNTDILELNSNIVDETKLALKHLFTSGEINESIFNEKLRKLIKAKLWLEKGQTKMTEKNTEPGRKLIEQQLVEKSICLLNNPDSLLPVQHIFNKRFTVYWIGNKINNQFAANLNNYVTANNIFLKPEDTNWSKKITYSQKRNFVIYVIDSLLADSHSINQIKIIGQNTLSKNSLFINLGNYQNLRFIPDSIACIQTPGNTENDFKYTAQAIFGGIAMEGRLPINIENCYKWGSKNKSLQTRLKYTIAEDAGLDSEKLKKIDDIVYEGISSGAFPGCQVFVAKDGKVVYNKSFGYHTYSEEIRVKDDDVYDLASVTKIAATTIACMKMISMGKMSLNDNLGKFFRNTKIDYTRIKPDTIIKIDTFYTSTIIDWKKFLKQNDTLNINDSSFVTVDTVITKLTPRLNIFKVSIVELLQHKSGIVPAMPVFRYMYYKAYYIKQLKDKFAAIHGKTGPMFDYRSFDLPESFPDNTSLPDSLKKKIKEGFKKQHEEYFSKVYIKDSSDIQLTANLYLKNKYFDTIWRDTKQLPVFSRKVFEYSDVNMILLQLAIDSLNNRSIDDFMKKNIYNHLGLKTITYLPLRYYRKNRIIPTEYDNSWRYGMLQGNVHDPSAALWGGMAGNAGLFSNAHDLGVLFQMVLNKGKYGGVQYISPLIIEQFTQRIDETQRGLGFDMPNRKAIVGKKASKKTFGHSGYTGTCIWVDPENKLVYVFLSNRNHTSSKNWRISSHKIRERIHDAIYDAIIKESEEIPDNKLLAENP